ncbi:MAG: DUF3024 domain-containing protein [Lentimicrobium sp.]
MALDILKSADIIEIMEDYIFQIRPKPEIRPQLDLGYEIENQSIILNEIRPRWDKPEDILVNGYAKATYVKSKNIWKIYWMRADGNWHLYGPAPEVRHLTDFLEIVEEDKNNCFKG